MNNQEFFTKTVQHLRKQGHKAISGDGSGPGANCRYLAPNGDMCAVGCHLGDAYLPEMENRTFGSLTVDFPVVSEKFLGVSTFLVVEMQRTHDHRHTLTWETCFTETAARWLLEVPPL